MRRPKISLCMIAKDEAEDLPRCLESVRGVADEIILVDTGSADGTADIARSFGARVIHFPWRDDFAEARNAGLKEAGGDWILFLDADEVLDAGDREKLLQGAWHTRYDGFFLKMCNYVGDGKRGMSINPVLRMFRNDKKHRFEGRIHEQIVSSICRAKPNASFHVLDVKIHHYGYLTKRIAARNKVSRNLGLLQKTLEESPDDPFHLYNIGIEFLRIGKREQALEAFRKARMKASPAWSYTHLLYKCEARTLQALGRCGEAVQICAEGIALYPDYTDLHHIKGACEAAMGKPDEARASLHAAHRLGPAPDVYHTEEGVGTYQTCYALGLLHESMRDYRVAADWYLEAMRGKPSLNPPLYRLFRFMKCRGLEKELAAMMIHRFRPDTSQAAEKLVSMLLETGCRRTANLLLRKWKPMISAAAYARARMICRMLRGKGQASGREPAPEDSKAEEWPLSMKIAFATGKSPLHLWNQRKHRLQTAPEWDAQEAQCLIRVAVDVADAHLERLSGPLASERHGLLQAARLAMPFADGF